MVYQICNSKIPSEIKLNRNTPYSMIIKLLKELYINITYLLTI